MQSLTSLFEVLGDWGFCGERGEGGWRGGEKWAIVEVISVWVS